MCLSHIPHHPSTIYITLKLSYYFNLYNNKQSCMCVCVCLSTSIVQMTMVDLRVKPMSYSGYAGFRGCFKETCTNTVSPLPISRLTILLHVYQQFTRPYIQGNRSQPLCHMFHNDQIYAAVSRDMYIQT